MSEKMSPAGAEGVSPRRTVIEVLLALSFSHMLNDTIQALLPSIYPMLKTSFRLSFAQIGFISLVYQCVASLLQPVIGAYADRRPMPYSLAVGMGFTLCGVVLIAFAESFPMLLVAAALVGAGSSVFHPEASRVAHLAAGRRRGFAQSLFQVGGNFGSSLGPLLAAWFIVPHGQRSIVWFGFLALTGIFVLSRIGHWYAGNLGRARPEKMSAPPSRVVFPRRRVVLAMIVLMVLVFSKFFYLVSLTNYYTFYLIHRFGVSVQESQIYLFLLLVAVAAGTLLGGPLGDRFGRKYVIWFSILGAAPFSLTLPHVGLAATAVLTVVIGVILASAFSVILVYAQELIPGKIGLIAGMFFGFSFGISGIAAAALGIFADQVGIERVFAFCAYLPLLGIFTVFLPNLRKEARAASTHALPESRK